MTLTARQYVALHLYYVEGQSYRRIGSTLGITGQGAWDLVGRGRTRLVACYVDAPLDASPLVEGLTSPSATASTTRHVGRSESRQDRLLDALERRMAHRAYEVEEVTECMCGNFALPTHIQRNHWDQWEMRYLNARPDSHGIPTTAYRADRAARYCASDPAMCGLGCVGCDRSR